MPDKTFNIFIIDNVGDEYSSSIQNVVYAAMLQSCGLKDKANILCVKLDSVLDWMPAGYIHVQGLGALNIMF